MINAQYNMSISDMDKFKEMKNTPMYRDYVQDIVGSPIFRSITKEHIGDVNVTEDIAKLQNDMKLTPTELNALFKKALSKMAVGIAADTIIMKEIIDLGITDTKDDIDNNFKVKYLLGLADAKYYKRAEAKLKKNPDTEGVLYRGLVEYMKLKESGTLTLSLEDEQPKPPKPSPSPKPRKSGINLEASEIKF